MSRPSVFFTIALCLGFCRLCRVGRCWECPLPVPAFALHLGLAPLHLALRHCLRVCPYLYLVRGRHRLI